MWIFTVSVDFPYKLLKKKKKTCLLKFGKKSSTLVNVVPDFRSIATREGGKWVNEFHPFPPLTKPSILNADIGKVQNRGNTRAHVYSFCYFRTLSFPACMACYGIARAGRNA